MPQPRSARFDATQATPHTPIIRVDILDGGDNIVQRDVPTLPDGSVTGDPNAANPLIREVDVPLSALSPAALNLLQNNLASANLQTYRGIRYEDTAKLGRVYNSVATWTPVNGGQLVGCTVNSAGALQLGP